MDDILPISKTMPDTDNRDLAESDLNTDPAAVAEGEEEQQRLELEVKVDPRSTCERHITVTIPHEDIERFFDKEFSELMPTAQVPGFRPGRAPRKLVETRFRKDIAGKVKSELVMNSLSQVNDEQKLSAISEPDFDFEAIELPDDGPMTFEFDIEVRPEFELPKWKGLVIEKPTREISQEDVEQTLENILTRRGRLVPFDGPASSGDYITTNLTFKHGDETLASAEEEVIRIRPVLSFRDGKIEGFDKLMEGVRGGETRQGEALLTEDAPNVSLRGQKVTAVFEVLEVKKLEVPEITPELLDELGGFQDAAELRDAIRDQLARQMDHEQHRLAREQITKALTVAANWELPPVMLKRQSHRELQRAVMELQRSGFSDEEIHAHENALRQNSMTSTAQALKEHFILERIAEDEKIDAVDDDYDKEIALIAAQSGESARRVRARLEKSGSMDVLRNQIVERKVIENILEHATFKETPYDFRHTDEEAVDHAAGGGDQSDIPDAKYDEEEQVPEAKKNEESGTKKEDWKRS
jgi:trigger factor